MGYLTLATIGLTVAAMLIGAFLGMIRGFNRSLLRLGLVVLSMILAIVLRGVVSDFIMNLELGSDGTIKEMLTASFTEGETELPESILDLIFVLIEILIGLVAYFALFYVIKFITWLILFPILKIFVRKGESKRKGLGALIGIVQGFIVAFALCAPYTGMLAQLKKISEIEMEGEKILELPEELGLDEYLDSVPGKIYGTIGGWYFDTITSAKDENGNNVSIDDTCDIVVTVVGVADTITDLTESMDKMTNAETPQEQMNAMKDVGDNLIKVGESINDLSTDAKDVVNELIESVKEMITEEGEEIPPEVEEALDNFDIDDLDLVAAGEAINGMATYIEKTDEEFDNNEEVTQEDVDAIVHGIANNPFILNLMKGEGDPGAMIEPEDEHRNMFIESIDSLEDVSAEDKDTLRALFGVK